jgi:replicative DNA helicase Mcm
MSKTEPQQGSGGQTLIDDLVAFFKTYYREEIAELAQKYPKDTESLYVDFQDVYKFNPDIADDLLNRPEEMLEYFAEAVDLLDLPLDVDLSGVTVRVSNLPAQHTYAPGQLRNGQGGSYIGVRGVLERVTSTSDLPQMVSFECQRCSTLTEIPQSLEQGELQEPHECRGCERQGPFKIKGNETEWSDYAKLRIESTPDADDGDSGKLVGYALDDLIDEGGDTGLIGRVGEPVTVYGICKRKQKTGRSENDLLFDHFLEARAIEFERDAETVDIEEHREEFEALANQPDAVDKFADSIAPQLHETDAWETAMEFAVPYLFGAPRIDLPNGPTYRGDLHFLIVSDYGMGKSTFKEDVEAYSPKCISKSTTALSSGVGLTAAAVKDDFGEGQWTIKPGLLVRANGGHLILDEIDKGPDQLTEMNDAIEGEQVVDIEKAGQSATYDSKCGLLALGNPLDGKFDEYDSISDQLDMSETLLSRFDAIVTMADRAQQDQDRRVAETFGQSFTEAQKAEIKGDSEFDTLEREVPIDVGRAWIKYAREEITPILEYEQFEELEDWYAEEVRQLNNEFAESGEAQDMPVPVTVRVLSAVTKMAIAFARVHLREKVTDADIERAKKLGKRLVKQNWDGERFDSTKNLSNETDSQKDRIDAIEDFIRENESKYDEGVPNAEIMRKADEIGFSDSQTEHDLDKLKQMGEIYEPVNDHFRTT